MVNLIEPNLSGTYFRPLTELDVAQVIEVERSCYSHPWSENNMRGCFGEHYHNIACCRRVVGQRHHERDEIIAYAFVTVVLDEAQLLNLCVRPGNRSGGVGEALLTEVIRVVLEKQAETMFLEVRESNSVAVALYRKLGFNEVGIRKGYYPLGRSREDAIVMALDIVSV